MTKHIILTSFILLGTVALSSFKAEAHWDDPLAGVEPMIMPCSVNHAALMAFHPEAEMLNFNYHAAGSQLRCF